MGVKSKILITAIKICKYVSFWVFTIKIKLSKNAGFEVSLTSIQQTSVE